MSNPISDNRSDRELLNCNSEDNISNKPSEKESNVSKNANSFDMNKGNDDSFFNLKRNKALKLLKQNVFQFEKNNNEEEVKEKVNEVAALIHFNPVEEIEKLQHYKHCNLFIKGVKKFFKRISMLCECICKNKMFENFILLTIILNCIIMAMQDPNSTSTELTYSDYIDYSLMGIYTFEMVVKIFGLGFVLNKGTYLRDPWNVLDFVIVTSGYLTIFLGASVNLKILRSFRVLRPLRTISGVEGLKIVVSSVMASIPMLTNTLLIMVFFLLVFAIAGVQLFSGALTQRCIEIATGFYDIDNDEPCGSHTCSTGYFCASNTLINPNYGATSFDNVFASMLIMYQTITLEGWTSIMVLLQGIYGGIVAVYFVPLVFIGSFFFLNLTLAVIKSKFTETLEANKKTKEAKKRKMLEELKDKQNVKDDNLFEIFGEKKSFFHTMVNKTKEQAKREELEQIRYLIYKKEMGYDELFDDEEYFLLDQMKEFIGNTNEFAKHYEKALIALGKKKNPQLTQSKVVKQKGSKNFNLKGIVQSNKLAISRERIKDDLDFYTNRFFKTSKKSKKAKAVANDANEWDKSFSSISEEDIKAAKKAMDIEEQFEEEEAKGDGYHKESTNTGLDKKKNENTTNKGDNDEIKQEENMDEDSFNDDEENENEENKALVLREKMLQKKLKFVIQNKKLTFNSVSNVLCIQEEEKLKEIHELEELAMKDKVFYQWEKSAKFYSNAQLKAKLEDELEEAKENNRKDTSSVSSRSSRSSASSSRSSTKGKTSEFSFTSSKMDKIKATTTIKDTSSVSKTSESFKTKKQQDDDDELYKKKFDMIDKYKKQIIKEAISSHREFNWSGEDVMSVNDYDLDCANWYCNRLSEIMFWQRGCGGYWDRFTYFLRKFVNHSLFEYFILSVVLGNTVIMLLDRYGISDDEASMLSLLNTIFTSIFAFEMGTKIIAIGVVDYLKDTMNVVDSAIVILSLVEIIFMSGSGSFSAFRSIRIFRTFRVVRVTRLIRAMKKMQEIIQVITQSISSFAYIALVLMLFVFIFALLGMELFGGKFGVFPDGVPRYNYETFTWAFLTSFQVLSLDNWFDIYYDSQRVQAGWISAIYYVVWIFVGNFVFLNLFFAILLDQFGNGGDDSDNSHGSDRTSSASSKGKAPSVTGSSKISMKIPSNANDQIAEFDFDAVAKKKVKVKNKNPLKDNKCERAFYILSKKNPIRHALAMFTKAKAFDNFILIVIIFSSLKLVYDTYLFNEPDTAMTVIVSNYLDFVFNGIFIAECGAKLITLGLCFNKGTYLRDYWNILDFIIVMSSIIDMSLPNVDLSMIKVLRMLRSLRPLRFISHNMNMKLLVKSLVNSIGGIISTFIVILIVFMIFGILGVNLYGGKFQYCKADMYNISNSSEVLVLLVS